MSEQITVGVLVVGLVALVLVWAGARAGRRVERVTRRAGRLRVGSHGSQAAISAAVIGAGQWAVLSWAPHPLVVAAVVGVPALLAGATVARWLAVAELVRAPRRGGRR